MKFSEAMEKLKSGSRVTRTGWGNSGLHLKMNGELVVSYKPINEHYNYDKDIMTSEDWFVDGFDLAMEFCDIVPHLYQGKKAKRSGWIDSYIFLDKGTRLLCLNSVQEVIFVPDFESFIKEDWVEF